MVDPANVEKLNRGDFGPILAMFADDATLAFPGNNGFASQFRRIEKADTLSRLNEAGRSSRGSCSAMWRPAPRW